GCARGPTPPGSRPISATPRRWGSPMAWRRRPSGRAPFTGACVERSRPIRGVDRMSEPRLSVVVPAFNEAESLPELHRELVGALEALGMTWEVLYVDDGS